MRFPMKGSPIFMGLMPKLVALVVATAVAVGATVGIVALRVSENALRERVLAASLKTADLAAHFAGGYIAEIEENVLELALNPAIVRAVERGSFAGASGELRGFLQRKSPFENVAVIDARGILRAHSTLGHPGIGENYSDRGYFQEVLATGKPALGMPLVSQATGRLDVPYAVPVFDRAGRVRGLVVAWIFPSPVAEAIIAIGIERETHAEIVDTREGGIVLAHADPQRSVCHPIAEENDILRRLKAGRRGTLETRDTAGRPVLAAFSPIPETPWGVVISVPRNIAFAGINTLMDHILLATLAVVLLAAFLSGWLTLRTIRPLMALRDAAETLASGDLSFRVNVAGNDEIGLISREFNRMAASLQASDTALRHRAENFFQLSLDLLCIVDFDGFLKTINPGWTKPLGFTMDELMARPFLDLVYPDDRSATRHAAAILISGGRIASFENRLLTKDGSYRWLLWNAVGLEDERNIYAVGRDITTIRGAAEALIRSEENFRRSLDDLPLGIRIVTDEGETLYANRALLEIYGFETLDELRATPTEKRYTSDSYAQFIVRRQRRRDGIEEDRDYDVDILRKDGRIRSLHVLRGKVLWNKEMQHQVVYQDVTERKRIIEELRRSDREKEMLLKEIHHRVKNNLQIIVSLLRLTSGQTGERDVDEILRESQNRVRAMAAVHTMLYKSENFADINFGRYISQTARELTRSYNIHPQRISLQIDAEDVRLPIDTAVPCGLIINELLSNALKHAFPEARSGTIRIEMRKEENHVKIIFADNGVGFPAGLDARNAKTLGLELVNMLVAQLDGRIEMRQEGGTTYTMTLKV